MMTSSEGGNSDQNSIRPRLWWVVVASAVLMSLVALLWPRSKGVSGNANSPDAAIAGGHSGSAAGLPVARRRFGGAGTRQPVRSAEEIVAEKVRQFGQRRRAIAERIAHRLGQ